MDGKRPMGETKEHALAYVKMHEVEKSVIMTAAGVANRVIDYGVPGRKGEDDILTQLQKMFDVPLQKAKKYMERFGKQMA